MKRIVFREFLIKNIIFNQWNGTWIYPTFLCDVIIYIIFFSEFAKSSQRECVQLSIKEMLKIKKFNCLFICIFSFYISNKWWSKKNRILLNELTSNCQSSKIRASNKIPILLLKLQSFYDWITCWRLLISNGIFNTYLWKRHW